MALLELLTGGGAGSRSIIQWFFVIFLFMFVMPKLYFYQIYAKIESSAIKLEALSEEGQKTVLKRTKQHAKKSTKSKDILNKFIDFFMIPPVSLDPFGLMKRLEHMIDNTEDRFKETAFTLAPNAGSEEKMNVYMGLQAAVMMHTIAKIVRHYVEMVKKFKNLQFAMILQMQLPMIEEMVKSEAQGLNAFLTGKPIGDAAGPLVIASFLKTEPKEIAPAVVARTEVKWGRTITFIKAKGPGGRLGKLGKAVQKSVRKNTRKIITVDAAAKLEGEKTGMVSEGVGIAMGGAGVQRSQIEDVAIKNTLPMDAIAIKMSQFEAIQPMPEDVVNALKGAQELVKERVELTPKGSHIIVVGVGNTCGIGNTDKGLNTTIAAIKREARKVKKEEEEKNKGWFGFKKRSGEANLMQLWMGLRTGQLGFRALDNELFETMNRGILNG